MLPSACSIRTFGCGPDHLLWYLANEERGRRGALHRVQSLQLEKERSPKLLIYKVFSEFTDSLSALAG